MQMLVARSILNKPWKWKLWLWYWHSDLNPGAPEYVVWHCGSCICLSNIYIPTYCCHISLMKQIWGIYMGIWWSWLNPALYVYWSRTLLGHGQDEELLLQQDSQRTVLTFKCCILSWERHWKHWFPGVHSSPLMLLPILRALWPCLLFLPWELLVSVGREVAT